MVRKVVSGSIREIVKWVGRVPLYIDSNVALFEDRGDGSSIIEIAGRYNLKVCRAGRYVLVVSEGV